MSVKKGQRAKFVDFIHKLIVTDPADVAVLRVIYEHAKPGWLDWDFSRPGQVCLRHISSTRGPRLPVEADGRLISMNLRSQSKHFPRTKALFEALAQAGFEIGLTLAKTENPTIKDEAPEQAETDEDEDDSEFIKELRLKMKEYDEKVKIPVTDPNDAGALRNFCKLNDIWIDPPSAGKLLNSENTGLKLTVENGRLVGLGAGGSHEKFDLKPLLGLSALRELKFEEAEIRDYNLLAEMNSLEVLVLNRTRPSIKGISFLAGLTSLRHLDLASHRIRDLPGHKIRDLSPLAGLRSLKTLKLSSNYELRNLAPLAALTGLEELSLRYINIEDLGPLAGLTSLHSLDLDYNHISDLGPLADLTALERLSLQVNQIRDISPLARMTSMKYLLLEYNKISDISSLQDMASMVVFAARNNNIQELGPLSRMISLRRLDLAGNRVKDITPLSDMTSLEKLSLEKNEIKNISPLARMTSLKYLNLDENIIQDISPLSELASLRELALQGNKVSRLEPLAGKKYLERLSLEGNRVHDLTPLAGLRRLSSLYLECNRINDLTPLAGLTRLSSLSVTGNEIKDFSPLWNLGREDETSDGKLWLYLGQFREVEGADPLGSY